MSEIKVPKRQKLREHAFPITIDRPRNHRFQRAMRDEKGDYIVNDHNEVLYDQNEWELSERVLRRAAVDAWWEWRRENETTYGDGQSRIEKTIPYHWRMITLRIPKKQPRNPAKLTFEAIYGEPVYVYMVQSDWSNIHGSVPHADREVFEERKLAELQCERDNKSPWTGKGIRGFYVEEKPVMERGEDWDWFDYSQWIEEAKS